MGKGQAQFPMKPVSRVIPLHPIHGSTVYLIQSVGLSIYATLSSYLALSLFKP